MCVVLILVRWLEDKEGDNTMVVLYIVGIAGEGCWGSRLQAMVGEESKRK